MEPTPEQEAVLREENLGVFATLRRDGAVQLTPINYAYEDGRVLISTTRDRAKYRNVKRNPNVSLCVVRAEGRPYVTVIGRAEIEEDDIVGGTTAIFRRMSDRPLPDNFAQLLQQQKRVLIVVRPECFLP